MNIDNAREVYEDWSDGGFQGVEGSASWVIIADVDESGSYEVDQTRIYKTPNGFVLANASGCSCWSGEWYIEDFATLDDLYKSLQWDDRAYNPSWKGALDLKEQAERYLNA